MIASAPCTQGRPWIYGKACYRQLPSILRMLRTLGTTRKRRDISEEMPLYVCPLLDN